MKFLVVGLVFILINQIYATEFGKCSDSPAPLELKIQGCEKQPCNFYRTKSVEFTFDILVNANISTLTTNVRAHAMGIDTNYIIDQPNACLSLTNGECPLDEGEVVTYYLQMPILSSYPTISVVIEFSLISEVSVVSCFKIAANIVDP